MLAAQPQRQPEIEEVGRRNLPWQGKVKCQACPRALPVSLLGGSNSCGDLGEDKPPLANLAPSPPRHCSPSAFPRAVGRVLCVGLPGGGAGGRQAPGRNCTESFEPPPELSQAPACSTEQAGSPRLSLPSPLFAMHSRSLCPGSTEALPSPDFSSLPSHPSAWFLAQPAPVSPLPLPILAGPPLGAALCPPPVPGAMPPPALPAPTAPRPWRLPRWPQLWLPPCFQLPAQPAWPLLQPQKRRNRGNATTSADTGCPSPCPGVAHAPAAPSPDPATPRLPPKSKPASCFHLPAHSQALQTQSAGRPAMGTFPQPSRMA